MATYNLDFCVEFKYDSDYIGQNHSHPCYELVYYFSGSGTIKINNQTYIFNEKSFSIVGPHEYHREIGIKDTHVIYIGFSLPSEVFLESGVYNDNDFMISEIMKEIIKESKGNYAYKQEILNAFTQIITLKIREKILNLKHESKFEIEYIKNYIKNNCMKDLNVYTLADRVGYSYDYFRHMFNLQTGQSVKSFIIEERIRYAKDLFTKTQYSIQTVSRLSGFNSPAHFTKTFRKLTGFTPSEFIKPLDRTKRLSEVIYLDDDSVVIVGNKDVNE